MVSFSSVKQKNEAKFEIVPILDVLFTLLIFFILYSVILTPNLKKNLEVSLPKAKSGVNQVTETVTISILSTGQVFVNQKEVPIDDVSNEIKAKMAGSSLIHVAISADRTILYDSIVKVLDQVRLGGCQDITLEVQPI